MTMMRNITSHSERAVAIESAEFSNELSGKASRAAFLVQILNEGTTQGEVPALMSNARGFIDQVSSLTARLGSYKKQSYRSLIPMVSLQRSAVHPTELQALADDLNSRLMSSNVAERTSSPDELAGRLEVISQRLAVDAYEMGRATVGV